MARKVIRPATRTTRCRFVELADVETGQATVFVSHTWGACFGDLVAAVEHALADDDGVYVWVDILAVRQWPGNIADLAFEPVVRGTDALLLVSVHLDSVAALDIEPGDSARRGELLPPDAGKMCAFFRVWCLVELAEALRQRKAVVMLVGGRSEDGGSFVPKVDMISNMFDLVDVQHATATAPD